MKRYFYLPDNVVKPLKSVKLSLPRGLNTRENVPMSNECAYRLFRYLGKAHDALFEWLLGTAPEVFAENEVDE